LHWNSPALSAKNSTAPASPVLKIAFVGLRGVPAIYGGVDRVVEEITRGLTALGHQVTVYCWSNTYRDRPAEYAGARLKYLPTIPVRYIGTLIHTFLACIDLASSDIDIVHINNTQNAIFGFIPRLFGKKVVVQPHGPAWPMLKWGTLRDRFVINFKILLTSIFLHFCRYPALWFADRIVVISGPDADYISRTRTAKFVLIHNGCNIPEVLPPEKMLELGIEPGKYLLFVGRIMPRKGCHYLIQAFRDIKEDLALVIVGGPLDTAYGKFLRRLAGDDPRINFTGPIYDSALSELFSNALIYVHPSESEGQSIALLEGLAYGACVVSSDTPESIETAEANAYYFKAGDVADLRRVLADLLANPSKIEEGSRHAREHVEADYQWHDKVLQYQRMYTELVKG
jgi:glycosyltransferase involved in cell wall biosynthesis